MSGPGAGWVERELEAEFPGLAVATRRCEGPVVADPGLAERLAAIASRIRGRSAIELRREPLPAAYRDFFRQVGLDPDARMTPVEAAVGRRLLDGGVRPAGPLAAALELAVLETCVPVYALDSSGLDGPVGVRRARAGEEVAGVDGVGRPVPGRLVLADAAGPLCLLFEDAHGRAGADRSTRSLLLVAIGVPGVAPMALDEALDVAAGAVGT